MNGLQKEWKLLLQKEEKILQDKKVMLFKEQAEKAKLLEMVAKEKIPPKVVEGLEKGFYQGLLLMFEKGSVVVEKVVAKEEIQVEFEVDNLRVDRLGNRKSIRKIAKRNDKKNLLNGCITTVEGVGLGVLGIGLPDIPVFLGMVMKGIYETALGYGFGYETKWEQVYILKLIRCALTSGYEKRILNEEVERFLKEKEAANYVYEEEMKKTATALAEAMLLGKFVQGMFVVGALGGATNPIIYNRIMKYVSVKYKKRYLIGKLSCV